MGGRHTTEHLALGNSKFGRRSEVHKAKNEIKIRV